MKKQVRKLALGKETLRNLGETELTGVAGAWTTSCASVELICKEAPTQRC